MSNNTIAKRLEVNGIVQGVGFRPFVYQLADRYGIKGEVSNSIKNGVVEPLKVKEQAMKSATEVTSMILRIDDVIASTKPKEGAPPGGMPDDDY